MTLNQIIQLLPKVVKYNLKIIFAGKFIWFLLAAFIFFAFFMFQNAWKREEINEGLIYSILLFPCILLIFYRLCSVSKMTKIVGYWKSFLVFRIINIKFGGCGYL